MQQIKKQNIRAILLISVFMSAVVFLSVIALYQIKSSTTEQVRENLQTLLLTIQEAHHILVEQRRFALESISENESVIKLTQDLIHDYQGDKPLVQSKYLTEFRQLLAPILENFGDQGFFIIAPDNISIASMRNSNLGTVNLIAQQNPELLARVFDKGEAVFIPPIRSDVPINNQKLQRISIDATMFIVSPIFDESLSVIAAIAIRINPMTYFSSVTTLGRVGETGETYAFDKSGTLLTESRFVEQLRKLSMLDYGENSIFNIQLKDPGGNLLKGFKPTLSYEQLPLTYMAQQATSGKSGVNTQGYRDYRGVNVIGAWIWDENFQFGVATEINTQEALQPYFKTRNTFIMVITITMILCLLMLKFLFRVQRQFQAKILQTNADLEVRVLKRTSDLEDAKEALSQVNQELAVLAITDGLTGLHNRRHFDNQFNLEWQRCLRDGKSIAIILFDIDYFKQYNDFYGHLMGDICLKNIGTLLMEANITKRPSDIIARYGGEEFIVMLSNTNHEYCQQAAQAICDNIRELGVPHERSESNNQNVVTVSVGYIVSNQLKGLRPNQLVARADKALYQAKSRGRNTVVEFFESDHANISNIHDRPSERK
ncbi:diguanylate cyclase [Thalassotalea sp. M1531]|uniref:diguanylate cyclase n=1 Tax=Thalassotalea algicola TaxID=2716224 RepID=A0A7Y0Q5H8_9GAMM|nr:sensor domain-containing diguanylate cyclase [Thalassotalea algicola]NMP30333.1 diguanylate cyclase [Thalassotalea algicola]